MVNKKDISGTAVTTAVSHLQEDQADKMKHDRDLCRYPLPGVILSMM